MAEKGSEQLGSPLGAAHGTETGRNVDGQGGKAVSASLIKPIVDGGIAVICLMLTILLDFGMAVLGNPAKLAELKAITANL